MPHWSHALTGRNGAGAHVDHTGSRAAVVAEALGSGALAWAAEVGESIAQRIVLESRVFASGTPVPELIGDATTETVLQALVMVADLDDSDRHLGGTTSVEAFAGDLAHRGVALDEFMETVRVGYPVLAEAFLDAAAIHAPPAKIAGELRRISLLLFKQLEYFTSTTTSIFIQKQRAWMAGVTAAQFEQISEIVAGGDIDVARAQHLLDYRFDGHHVAVAAWADPSSGHDLRSAVVSAIQRWGTVSSVLVIPIGVQSVWAWGAVSPRASGGRPSTDGDRSATVDGMRIAMGQIGEGLDGFRRSHLEAREVEKLVRLNPAAGQFVTAHEDVALDVLLLADPEAARLFATRVLGPLVMADQRAADQRATLIRYLDSGHSLAAVAAAEHISKNTVTYRVQKALSHCAYDGGSTTEIRAALRVAEWFFPR